MTTSPIRAVLVAALAARALAAAIVVSLLVVTGAASSGAQPPKRGGTVVLSFFREPACLNIFLDPCGNGFVYDLVLGGTFATGPSGTPRALLVSRVALTRKAPFTLTYHIRPKARWSDGVPVSADDFLFSYRAAIKGAPADDPLKQSRVRVVNGKTFRVVLRTRIADWQDIFPPILPRHALRGEDIEAIWHDAIDNPKTGEPISDGPFLIGRWERGKRLTMVRNPRYWGSHPSYLDRLVLRWTRSDDDPVAELRSGEADVVRIDDPQLVPELRRLSGVRVLPVPTSSWEHIAIRIGSGGHPALKSKLVRRALAYGIDRRSLIRASFADIAPKLPRSDSAVLLAQNPSYRPHWGVYVYRPAEARRLLEAAGCRRGSDGIYGCGGERLSLRLLTTAGNPRREETARRIQAQLRKVGVEVVPSFSPSDPLFEQILPSGDYDLALFAHFPFPTPSELVDIYGCGGDRNWTGYCQRLVTSKLNESKLILDPGQRVKILNSVDAVLATDVPVIPLFQNPGILATRATLRNLNPGLALPIWNAADWWLAR